MKRIKALWLWMLAFLVAMVCVFPAYSSSRYTGYGFAICLSETNEVVLSDLHIVSYNKNTHEIKLTEEGIKRWQSRVLYDYATGIAVPKLEGLFGKKFVIKLDNKNMYEGVFWTIVSSQSYQGVAIFDTLLMEDSIRIVTDYETLLDYRDVRDNQQIFDFFESRNKLVQ